LKISKNSQKSQNSDFKILVHHFFAFMSPVYCKKKFDSIQTKLTEEIHFEVCHSGNLPPIVACRASTGSMAGGGRCAPAVNDRCADPEMLRPHYSVVLNWGHSERYFRFLVLFLFGRWQEHRSTVVL